MDLNEESEKLHPQTRQKQSPPLRVKSVPPQTDWQTDRPANIKKLKKKVKEEPNSGRCRRDPTHKSPNPTATQQGKTQPHLFGQTKGAQHCMWGLCEGRLGEAGGWRWVVLGGGWVFRGSEFSPGLTPASMGSGWWVNGMRADLVWPDRALKSNFPGFLREPGDESPGKKTGSTEWQKRDRRF